MTLSVLQIKTSYIDRIMQMTHMGPWDQLAEKGSDSLPQLEFRSCPVMYKKRWFYSQFQEQRAIAKSGSGHLCRAVLQISQILG